MRTLFAILILTVACFGQGKQNVVQTGVVDARGANWLPPSATFASPPSSPATGSVYIFTDASAAGTCAGTGIFPALCRWSSGAWQAIGGGGGSGVAPVVATFDTSAGTCTSTAGSCVASTGPPITLTVTHGLNNAHVGGWVDDTGGIVGSNIVSAKASSANVFVWTFTAAQAGTATLFTGGMGPAGGTGPAGGNGSAGTAGAGYLATSTSSLATAGSGSKTFTTQAGLAYTAGARIGATSAGTGDWMEGVVTSYSGTSLVATMSDNSGTGTHADWNLNLIGRKGDTGAAGTGTGDASTNTSASVDGEVTLFSGTNGKLLKRATGTGYMKVASGVLGTPSAIPVGDIPSGVTLTVASGTSALGTGSIGANACASVVTTAATGTLSTDTINWTPNADIGGVTGYGAASTDGLIVYPYPTSGNVNFHVCNATGASITPGAVTLNWSVRR